MAFTDTSNNVYRKIILVRVQHAEYRPSFTDLGGGLYEYGGLDKVLASLSRNGDPLTRVAGTPTVDDTYSYDGLNGTVVVKLASAPDPDVNTLVFVTYLFYTNERARALPQDPLLPASTTNPLRDWEAKVSNVPTFRQSISNNLSGILSTSGSSIDIINTDNSLNGLVGLNGSFANRVVDVWIALDSVNNIDKVYSGIVSGVSVNDTIFTFRMTDITGKLNAQAWMGDSQDEVYYTSNTNPQLDPSANQTPVVFYIGPASRTSLTSDGSVVGITDAKKPSFESLESAINIDVDTTVSATTNREWNVGRSFNGTHETSCTISALVAGGFGSDFLTFTPTLAAGSRFHVGQATRFPGSGFEERVVRLDANGDVVVTWDSGNASPAVSDTVLGARVTAYISGVNSDGSSTFVPFSSLSVSESATSGGNVNTKLVFNDDFEAGISDFGADKLSPNNHQVGFLAVFSDDNAAASPIQHDDVVEKVLEKAGVIGSVGLPAFVNNSVRTTELQFSIPYFDETDFGDYRSYLETVLLTTNGVLYTGVDEVVYDELAIPTTQVATVTSDRTLKGSRRLEVEYRDLAYFTTGFNPHSPVSETGLESSKHRYLHAIDTATRFRHVAVQIDPDVLELRSKLNRNRKAVYTHKTFAENLGSSPTDEVTLQHDVTPNPDSTTNVFLTEVTKSVTDTTVKSSDLLDD